MGVNWKTRKMVVIEIPVQNWGGVTSINEEQCELWEAWECEFGWRMRFTAGAEVNRMIGLNLHRVIIYMGNRTLRNCDTDARVMNHELLAESQKSIGNDKRRRSWVVQYDDVRLVSVLGKVGGCWWCQTGECVCRGGRMLMMLGCWWC